MKGSVNSSFIFTVPFIIYLILFYVNDFIFLNEKMPFFSATSTFHHYTKKPTKCLKGGVPSCIYRFAPILLRERIGNPYLKEI